MKQVRTERSDVGGRVQESDVAGPGRGGRMSRQRKTAAVLRLLRGEDLETVSRSLGVTAATFASWLNFQRALFNFSKARPFIIVTDIANYYDSISYVHLRNIISSISGVEECVLDMLIYVLSSLLWQPDYMPRVEIRLPQINLDAPRLLAHCFLYELDTFLASDPNRDFVRFMDDINVGVESITDAKRTLRSIDLVLQTRQIRLNSGKTLMLSQSDALKHFRVVENARLDLLKSRIKRKLESGLNTDAERRLIVLASSRRAVRVALHA